VVTKTLEENKGNVREKVSDCVDRLQAAGIRIVFREKQHQRFSVIDQHIVWYGSINPLGFTNADDNNMRLEDMEVAVSLLDCIVRCCDI
jgi:hypothetical protein